MKRWIDITVAMATLTLLFPFGLIICLILRFTGEGKVWYRQDRIGFAGKHFRVFKFVTMYEGSETQGSQDITVRNDPRVLPVGRVLRKTKINELPQLINILLGDMSLVGWRPLVPRGFAAYSPEIQQAIVKSKPGLTGIGSIVFRDEEAILDSTSIGHDACYRDIAAHKGALELWYNEHCSLWLDLKVVFCTAWVILFPNSKIYTKLFPDLPEPDPIRDVARYRDSIASKQRQALPAAKAQH